MGRIQDYPLTSLLGGEDVLVNQGGVTKRARVGQAGGLAELDAHGRVVQDPASTLQPGGVAGLGPYGEVVVGQPWSTTRYDALGRVWPGLVLMHYAEAQNGVQLAAAGYQGVARDAAGYWYAIDTAQISKITPDNSSVIATGDPASNLPGNHYGDGQVYAGYLWVPVETYNGGAAADQALLKVNLSDLSLVQSWPLDPNHEAAGVALWGDYVFIASYQGQEVLVYKFNGSALNLIGRMRMSHVPRYVNGIAVRHNRMVLWADYTLWFYRVVSPLEAVLEYAVHVTGTGWSEGVIWDQDNTIIVHDGGSYRYEVAVPVGPPSPPNVWAQGARGAILVPPPTGQLYLRLVFPELPGTRNIFDSALDQDTTEMWIYANGKINALIGRGTKIYGSASATVGSPVDIVLRWWRELDGTVSYDLSVDGVLQGSVTGNTWAQMDQWYLPASWRNGGASYEVQRLAVFADLDDHSSEVFG